MKIVLWGGIGNQLFQFSYLHNYARHDARLDYDSSLVKERDNIIGLLELCDLADRPLVSGKFPGKFVFRALRILRKFKVVKMNGLVPVHSQMELHEKTEFIFNNVRKLSLFESVPIRGFFQHWRYVDNVWDQISQEIQEFLNRIELGNEISERMSGETIALHVRGGDYLIQSIVDIYGELSTKYYTDSITLARLKVSDRAQIIVVTNDSDFAKKLLGDEIFSCSYIIDTERYSAWQSFKIMAQSNVLITANSTFSWWAGFLSSKNGGTVITPEPWFTSNIKKKEIALSYPAFIKVESGFR